MINNTWSDGPAGLPGEGLVVRPRGGAARLLGDSGTAGIACGDSVRRDPEAFTAPFQGTGLPFGGAVVDTVAPITQRPAAGLATTDNVHTDTTLGNHSSRRPPS
jgi:hypothetical protein